MFSFTASHRYCTGLLLLAVVLAMVSTGECIRARATRDYFKRTLDSQLPRGPVPPSGPSPCHNKISSFHNKEFSFTYDYVMCP
ncbi:Transmembrane protein [Quillaja saponaria]|uniref:Transmembrane protein n=1 Tax=Quillaja saponaria TaxID=32244 RepID=A0AAD7P5H5_QUISA|nr:Transmembrane protein [Quillaja saponaria]